LILHKFTKAAELYEQANMELESFKALLSSIRFIYQDKDFNICFPSEIPEKVVRDLEKILLGLRSRVSRNPREESTVKLLRLEASFYLFELSRLESVAESVREYTALVAEAEQSGCFRLHVNLIRSVLRYLDTLPEKAVYLSEIFSYVAQLKKLLDETTLTISSFKPLEFKTITRPQISRKNELAALQVLELFEGSLKTTLVVNMLSPANTWCSFESGKQELCPKAFGSQYSEIKLSAFCNLVSRFFARVVDDINERWIHGFLFGLFYSMQRGGHEIPQVDFPYLFKSTIGFREKFYTSERAELIAALNRMDVRCIRRDRTLEDEAYAVCMPHSAYACDIDGVVASRSRSSTIFPMLETQLFNNKSLREPGLNLDHITQALFLAQVVRKSHIFFDKLHKTCTNKLKDLRKEGNVPFKYRNLDIWDSRLALIEAVRWEMAAPTMFEMYPLHRSLRMGSDMLWFEIFHGSIALQVYKTSKKGLSPTVLSSHGCLSPFSFMQLIEKYTVLSIILLKRGEGAILPEALAKSVLGVDSIAYVSELRLIASSMDPAVQRYKRMLLVRVLNRLFIVILAVLEDTSDEQYLKWIRISYPEVKDIDQQRDMVCQFVIQLIVAADLIVLATNHPEKIDRMCRAVGYFLRGGKFKIFKFYRDKEDFLAFLLNTDPHTFFPSFR